jgi:hypothetical protein
MGHAKTMSTITVELTIKVKTKYTPSNAEKTKWIHLTTDVKFSQTLPCGNCKVKLMEKDQLANL